MDEQPQAPSQPKHWTEAFAGRELEEIKFARVYHQQFGHGTPGHLHLLLISQLSRLVDALTGRDPDWDRQSAQSLLTPAAKVEIDPTRPPDTSKRPGGMA